ncbi:nitroreductase family protein [Candidatus Woesearchaeota archaeon]|nr:nitroreductase family protein [Candidatus Woesearchaeota archaeon]
MDVVDSIVSRRSVRRYRNQDVEWYKVAEIIDAGRYAPSSGNLQERRFIVVQSAGNRKALASASFDQHWMESAPIHIVVCSDIRNVERLYGARGTRLYAVQNAAASAQNMLLCAHSLGLGSCWVGAFNEDTVSSILGLEEFIRPQVIITVGYSDEKPSEPLRARLESMVYFEGWSRQSGMKIEQTELLKYIRGYGILNEIRLNKAKEDVKKSFGVVSGVLVEKFKSLKNAIFEKMNKK